MKQINVLLIGTVGIVLFLSCTSKIKLHTSASATYLGASDWAHTYFKEILLPISKMDSTELFKIYKNSLNIYLPRPEILKEEASLYSLWSDADKEVKQIETLHPEFSDSKEATEYVQFMADSFYGKQFRKARDLMLHGPNSILKEP